MQSELRIGIDKQESSLQELISFYQVWRVSSGERENFRLKLDSGSLHHMAKKGVEFVA